MKSKNSFPDVQPWRVQVRFKDSLQDSLLIALGSTSVRAEKHVRKFFPKNDFDIVDIYPITTSTMVAFACFCDQYANPLLSVDLTDVPMIHGIDGSSVTLTDLNLVTQFQSFIDNRSKDSVL